MDQLTLATPWGLDGHGRALLALVTRAAGDAGLTVTHHGGGLPVEPGTVVVPAPEPVAWTAPDGGLERAVLLGWQRPGTPSYESAVRHAAGARFELRAGTLRRLAILGVPAEPFRLGAWEGWSAVGAQAARDLDVLVVGRFTHRRARVLAGLAGALWRRRAELRLLEGDEPLPADLAGLCARARVLVHVHDDEGDAELPWELALPAIANGCAVLVERSTDVRPLRAGHELLVGHRDSLGPLLGTLLDDEPRRTAIAQAAARALAVMAPLRESVQRLAGASARLRAAAAHPRAPELAPLADPPRAAAPDPSEAERLREDKRGRLAQLARRREEAGAAAGGDEVLVDRRDGAAPRVSVLVTLYEHRDHIAGALASSLDGGVDDVELVVVDDASGDDSAGVAAAWLRDHGHVPALLVRHASNRGLPVARNTALAHARGELVFVLDSDNAVLPGGLARLVGALDRDPDAAFAYGMLEMFGTQGPVGLRSWRPWRPEVLARENPIDAMALIRRAWLERVGGYTTDQRLHGWEDYDLWCAIAEARGHAAFVPEIVGRYRVAEGSMLSLVDISHDDAYAALRERHPRVMGAG